VAASIRLPGRDGALDVETPRWNESYLPPTSRAVLAAAHVAAQPDGTVDWDSTMAFRDYLWDNGFGLADAMDTAQRGMGLSWPQTQELIARSGARAARRGALIACGAGTDQLPDGVAQSLPTIRAAYLDQLAVVRAAGARPILMASRALAASGASAHDYLDLYAELIAQAGEPVILHWLGEQFDPALRGYWGSADLRAATDVVAQLVAAAPDRVDGVKVSVLDPDLELALRHRLPEGVRCYTGDDFNFASLIRGDASGHSDALLGAFAAVAAPAAHALHALDIGDLATYDAVMGPAEELARKVFEAPTSAYKVGVAFLAWLNGFQPHFAMLDGLERQRSTTHLVEVFELAAVCGALIQPDLAVTRMSQLLAERGAGARS
jgi:Protein of unknown function (DUF993)